MYIGDYVGRRAVYSPARPAVVDTGKRPEQRFTYAELNARANRLANWLRATAGLQKGDRAAILARDGIEHLDLFFACGKLGAIHVPYNRRLHWRELAALIEQTRPGVLFFSDDDRGTVTALSETLHTAPRLVHLDGPGIDGSLAYSDLLAQAPDRAVTCNTLEAADTAALIFTGGTTGLPKAACITHGQIAWNTLNTVIHDLQHDDVYLNVFPLFHTGGLFVYTLPQVILGGTTILMRQFDPAQVLDLMARERVTVFAGVPTMYELLTQAPNWPAADLSSLRFCTSGGAPLPVPLVERYTTEKQVRFKQGFGMTEFGPGIFALAPEDALTKAGSIGRPNFYVDARIVDDLNRPLPAGQTGELLLKGPSAAAGYYEDPAASAAAVDQDGWFHTGDLARCDDEWYFTIVGRKKEMFISGGENIYPAEIEAVLYRHPAVALAAVFGVPDPAWGEVGKACVTLKPGSLVAADELLTFLQANLARYKVPRRVEILDSLPVSAAGKILKHELHARYVA